MNINTADPSHVFPMGIFQFQDLNDTLELDKIIEHWDRPMHMQVGYFSLLADEWQFLQLANITATEFRELFTELVADTAMAVVCVVFVGELHAQLDFERPSDWWEQGGVPPSAEASQQ